MEKLSFKSGEFEGPLDLMLYLISKHKLDILDIQISALLEQYMLCMGTLEGENLETASEFLEMASRLVYIKTVMLLPKHEEEGERLKRELQGQLLEYNVCKQVAKIFGTQIGMCRRFVRGAEEFEMDKSYLLSHPASILYTAYQDAVGRGRRYLPPPANSFSGIVSRRVVSVESRVIFLLKRLYIAGRADYGELFDGIDDRSELVATFMALLELMKSKRIFVEDNGNVILNRKRVRPLSGENVEKQIENCVAEEETYA